MKNNFNIRNILFCSILILGFNCVIVQAEKSNNIVDQTIISNKLGKNITAYANSGKVGYGYATTGFFAFDRDAESWDTELDDMTRIGGDTIITLGHQLRRRSEAQIKTDRELWGKAMMGPSEHILDRVRSRLKYARTSNEIERIFILNSSEYLGNKFRNSVYDVVDLNSGGHRWWALLFRKGEADNYLGTWSDFARHPTTKFDVVLIAGSSPAESRRQALLNSAGIKGFDVYLGPPMPETQPEPLNWKLESSSLNLYHAVFKIYMEAYKALYSNEAAFAGIYHSLEVKLTQSPLSSHLGVYKQSFEAFSRLFPDKQTLLSPYWDAATNTVSEIKAGFKQLARVTNVDIIAPMTGRGTGKAALFFNPSESGQEMPAHIQEHVNAVTYKQKYLASIGDLFKETAAAVNELANEQPSIGVKLWANLEAFEPVQIEGLPIVYGSRGRTTKVTMDKHLMHIGRHVSKIISFRWGNCYNSWASDPPHPAPGPLVDEIVADISRPIIVDVTPWNNGLLVYGYNLGNTSVSMTYYDSDWQLRSASWGVNDGWANVNYYVNNNTPQPLHQRFVPFANELAKNFIAYLHATRFGKKTTHRYHWDY